MPNFNSILVVIGDVSAHEGCFPRLRTSQGVNRFYLTRSAPSRLACSWVNWILTELASHSSLHLAGSRTLRAPAFRFIVILLPTRARVVALQVPRRMVYALRRIPTFLKVRNRLLGLETLFVERAITSH
jgi:hypothetical protein